MTPKVILRPIITFVLVVATLGQASPVDKDSAMTTMTHLIDQALLFSERLPREKVSVHLDNTGYFRGDKIWFQCYVVDGINNAPTSLSHTLYVELLNPRGKVLSKQILKIENGRCHGAFSLNHLPFYSGFYEIRAYTKYMLNFGDGALFSRAIPVFDAPKVEGDFSEWRMARNISKYPGSRPKPQTAPKMSVRFFPEGGNLITGIPAKVAFEITGRNGMPVEGKGRVIDESNGHTIATFESVHEGRGLFEMTPDASVKYKAVVIAGDGNSENKFSLPLVRDNGIGLSVDNLSVPDSILITVNPALGDTISDIAGISISSRGVLWSYAMFDLTGKRTLKFSSKEMPSGVSVITLFDRDGQTQAERMIFVNNGGYGKVTATLNDPEPAGNSKVTLDITATDASGKPAALLPLSVSVADGNNAVDYQDGLLSDLLLMSEIKGYVHNPMQYFSNDTVSSRRNLDLLMMVHGWRCYSWEEMADIKPIRLQYYPEHAIDLDGQVVSFVRGIPKANTDLSMIVSKKNVPNSLRQNFTSLLTTDSCGRFHLSYDFDGKWDLVMSVSENGKKKDHRVILDRLFAPKPREYEPAEMLLNNYAAGDIAMNIEISDTDSIKDDASDALASNHSDKSLNDAGIKLNEVVIKGKNNRESDIYKARLVDDKNEFCRLYCWFLISYILQKSLKISNFKEKFSRFFHESYDNSQGLRQS